MRATSELVVFTAVVAALALTGPAHALGNPAPAASHHTGTAPVPDGWLGQVERDLATREYEMSWQSHPPLPGLDAAWQAPNRAHGFRTYFTPEGIRVVPRTEADPSWIWGLSLVGYGRGQTMWPVGEPRLSPTGNRLDSRRGTIDEWYVNDSKGLKQGFQLWAAPEEAAGQGGLAALAGRVVAPGRSRGLEDAGLVHLDLELDGELLPVVAADGLAIDFVTPAGARVLRYAELVVTDARGDLLPAWMEGVVDGVVRGIRLVVDDREAVYPITIDPLATSPAWTAQGTQFGEFLGVSVATAGDVNGDGYDDVIVGAEGYDNGQTDEGRAYVYHGSASGLSLTPNWTAESNQTGSGFGFSVATAGDVNGDGYADVIVGAYLFDVFVSAVTVPDAGRAFVYHGSASGLSTTANWTASTNQAGGSFGISGAAAGDVNGDGYGDVIVGAYLVDSPQTDEGLALVYLGSGFGLSATPSWTAEGNQAVGYFGYAVGTAGDVNGDGYADVIVGALYYDDLVDGYSDAGRAWVYHGNASGVDASPSWDAESNQAGARFGFSVGTAGDIDGDGYADVVVGADFYDNGQTDEGAAFVYRGSVSGLSLTHSWMGESDQNDARYGAAVGLAGDVNGDGYADVIVGAYGFDNGQTNEGRAFLYQGSASGLSVTSSWTAESDQAGAFFGYDVGTAGDVNGDGYADVIVGAYTWDTPDFSVVDIGRAFVYLGSASGPATSAGWAAEGDQAGAGFGISVGTAGDVNGDGYADVIVGAIGYDNGQNGEGRAFVYHGSVSGLAASPAWTAESDQELAGFGISVGTAGDVNGDGFADVIVGAQGYDNAENGEGRAFVFHGSAAGLAATPAWTAESDHADAQFGVSVGTAGDVNGDGYADVIVGASFYSNGEIHEGRAFAYHGSASGLAATAAWMAESDQANAQFGISVGTAGDVNGDGYADVIVGAWLFENGETNEGRAFAYHGSAAGLAAMPAWTAESDQADALFGRLVGTAGDVDGDGYADVIVGAYVYDNGQADEGRAYVHHGSASGLEASPAWTAESDQAGAWFGAYGGTAGDVNGDGYADVIVGAVRFDNGQLDEGRAFVYHGSASGLAATPAWTAETNQVSAGLDLPVETAGDVNGDGYADVIIGARFYTNGQSNEGRAFLYYGNGGHGLSLRPQQRRDDDAVPIAPMGGVTGSEVVRLAALGRTPFGRGLVKLEWEVKPLGTPLNGTGLQTGSDWLDTGTAGVALNEIVAGLADGTVHHWRLRLRYHPATSPFQRHSRWLTVPWNGWQEGDFRTIALADLGVSQTSEPNAILYGTGNVTFTVNVTNAGPDDVPVGLSYLLEPDSCTFYVQAPTPSQGTCTPAGGAFDCQLGVVGAGDRASVEVTVMPQAPCEFTSFATADIPLSWIDPNPEDNLDLETATVLPNAPGDRAWEDTDGDGVQDPSEPGLEDVLVARYDGAGNLVDATLTDATGEYSFPTLNIGATYRLRFFPPPGYVLTVKDQGTDDLLDSDADPVTLFTPPFAVTTVQDPFRWDAGMHLACFPPDEPVFIANVTMTPQGFAILQMQDPNQPRQVTGYNIYRSSDPSPPPGTWPLLASDVVDMDAGTPNIQWVDDSGDPSPGEVWFYNATAYHHDCPAEGPF